FVTVPTVVSSSTTSQLPSGRTTGPSGRCRPRAKIIASPCLIGQSSCPRGQADSIGAIDDAEVAMGALQARRAVITGAGSGIGRSAALRFAAEGALVGALDRDREAVAETAAR